MKSGLVALLKFVCALYKCITFISVSASLFTFVFQLSSLFVLKLSTSFTPYSIRFPPEHNFAVLVFCFQQKRMFVSC
jgi:hypothetical protein